MMTNAEEEVQTDLYGILRKRIEGKVVDLKAFSGKACLKWGITL